MSIRENRSSPDRKLMKLRELLSRRVYKRQGRYSLPVQRSNANHRRRCRCKRYRGRRRQRDCHLRWSCWILGCWFSVATGFHLPNPNNEFRRPSLLQSSAYHLDAGYSRRHPNFSETTPIRVIHAVSPPPCEARVQGCLLDFCITH